MRISEWALSLKYPLLAVDVVQLIFIIISNAEFWQHLAASVGYYWNTQ